MASSGSSSCKEAEEREIPTLKAWGAPKFLVAFICRIPVEVEYWSVASLNVSGSFRIAWYCYLK